ncbi:MAG: CRISPR-associated endonuclease Cas6 [Planctomycetaceae bacterium]
MNAEVATTTLIEHCIVSFQVSQAVNLEDARRLRGAIAQVMQRFEFHNHLGQKLNYVEPLIRYLELSGKLNAVGICNGAMLLKELPRFQSLRLGQNVVDVHRQTTTPSRVEVGPVEKSIRYRFVSECLPLNQENDQQWRRMNQAERSDLLRRILIGNILSFAKGIGMSVTIRLEADCELVPVGFRTLKPGVRLLGFTGEFSVNFKLPPMWGLGKSTSRGFGTVQQLEDEK